MAILERGGWLEQGVRVVVTSDHGELLGEHGLLGHGHYLWEEVTRVPLLVLDSAGAPALPADLNALDAFSLVRDGALPGRPAPPLSVALPEGSWVKWSGGRFGAETSLAAWDGDDKLLWTDGEWARYDLAADPGEAAPAPGEAHPLRGLLEPAIEATEESAARPFEGGEGLSEALKAMGYVE